MKTLTKSSEQSITLSQAKQDYESQSPEVKLYLQAKFGRDQFTPDWLADYRTAIQALGYTELSVGHFDMFPENQRARAYYRHVLATIIEHRNNGWRADITNHAQRKYEVYLYHDDKNGFGFGVCYVYDSSVIGADLQMCSQELAEELKEKYKDLWIAILK